TAPGFVIVGANNKLPASLDALVQSAGGQLTTQIPEIGVAFATSADPAFLDKAGKIAGGQGVPQDRLVQWTEPEPTTDPGEDEPAAVVTPNATVGAAETFRPIQWAPDAVHGPGAWNSGNLGAGARVAIIDGGIRSTHIDIAPNLDVAHSASFVSGFAFNQD